MVRCFCIFHCFTFIHSTTLVSFFATIGGANQITILNRCCHCHCHQHRHHQKYQHHYLKNTSKYRKSKLNSFHRNHHYHHQDQRIMTVMDLMMELFSKREREREKQIGRTIPLIFMRYAEIRSAEVLDNWSKTGSNFFISSTDDGHDNDDGEDDDSIVYYSSLVLYMFLLSRSCHCKFAFEEQIINYCRGKRKRQSCCFFFGPTHFFI